MTAPSSTFFTASPGWEWLVICYFFVGGLAGGSYFLAVLLDFFGTPADRALARLGYYVAFPAIVVSGILLTLDLGRPERFWHMLLQSARGVPMFKAWSPMSIGSWALLAFGFFALLSFLAALSDAGRIRAPRLAVLRPPHVVGAIVAVLGGLLGFFVAGYTGVLLSVTNRPLWADTPLLGMLFVVSAASISAALLVLLGAGARRLSPGWDALRELDAWVLVLELLVLVALTVSLGGVVRIWVSGWGVLLLLGVVGLGMVLPLLLHWRPRLGGEVAPLASAALVLAGGFLLRVIIVLSVERV